MENKKPNIGVVDYSVTGISSALYAMRFPRLQEPIKHTMTNKALDIVEDAGTQDRFDQDMNLNRQLIETQLIGGGRPSHHKHLRMMHIQCFARMPISFWYQYDTYKIGTNTISGSRMHMFGKRLLTADDFSNVNLDENEVKTLLAAFNADIQAYTFYKAKGELEAARHIWKTMIDKLPMCFIHERALDFSVEVLLAMLQERYTDVLDEWRIFLGPFIHDVFLSSVLPMDILIGNNLKKEMS